MPLVRAGLGLMVLQAVQALTHQHQAVLAVQRRLQLIVDQLQAAQLQAAQLQAAQLQAAQLQAAHIHSTAMLLMHARLAALQAAQLQAAQLQADQQIHFDKCSQATYEKIYNTMEEICPNRIK
jgi:hypothetical protein